MNKKKWKILTKKRKYETKTVFFCIVSSVILILFFIFLNYFVNRERKSLLKMLISFLWKNLSMCILYCIYIYICYICFIFPSTFECLSGLQEDGGHALGYACTQNSRKNKSFSSLWIVYVHFFIFLLSQEFSSFDFL